VQLHHLSAVLELNWPFGRQSWPLSNERNCYLLAIFWQLLARTEVAEDYL